MLRAAVLVFVAHGAGTILSFLRNVIIGRMVSVDDFGVVSTFALAFAIIEMATNAGFDRFLVQSNDGHKEGFQSNLQLLQVARGAIGLVFFLVFAWPYAWFLGNLDIYWAYLAMSVVPLIRGFIHFDVYRLQREMRFWPTSLVTAGAPFASLLTTAALLPFVTDFRIMLIAIVVQQFVYVVLTHVLAERRWQLSWDRDATVKALRFGLPLLGNGALVFAIHNGDMLLVGGFLGMEVLGWFYVATLLTITGALHLDTTVRSIVLPGLSRSVDDGTVFAQKAADAVQFSAAAALIIMMFIYLLGPTLVIGLFGSKYDQALPYLIPLTMLYAIKTLKVGPNVIAIARAETHIPALTNLPRAISLLLAAWLMWHGAGLVALLVISISSEVICVVIAFVLATRAGGGLRRSAIWHPLSLVLGVGAVVVIATLFYPASAVLSENFYWVQLPVTILAIAAMLSLPSLRQQFLRF